MLAKMGELKSAMLQLFVLAIIVATHLLRPEFIADDAYIHLRIASNFVSSGAPYFNAGEAVNASSSMLWTLLLSVFVACLGPKEWLLPLLAAVSLAALTRESWVFLRTRSSQIFAVLGTLGVLGATLSTSLQGMETPLALFLLVRGFNLLSANRAGACIYLSLAACTRLECLVFLLLCVSFLPYAKGKKVSEILAVFLPYLAFLLFMFGSLIPQSVVAKSAIYKLSIFDSFFLSVRAYLGPQAFDNFPLLVSIFSVALLVLFFFDAVQNRGAWISKRQETIMLWGAILIWTAYLLRTVYVFPWYSPLYVVPLLLALVGRSDTSLTRYAALFVCVCPLLLRFLLDGYATVAQPAFFSQYEGGQRALAYRQLGAELTRACPNCTLLAAEIGGLAVGFPGRVYDAAGLASPDAVPYQIPYQANNFGGVVAPDYVAQVKPDFVVGVEAMLSAFKQSTEFKNYSRQDILVSHQGREGKLEAWRRNSQL